MRRITRCTSSSRTDCGPTLICRPATLSTSYGRRRRAAGQDLRQLRDNIVASDIEWSSIGIDVQSGRLRLNVPTAADYKVAVDDFATFADVAVAPRLTTVTCVSRPNCTPWRGGIEIVDLYQTEECSYGFNALGNSSGSVKALTAAHCGSHTWRNWNQTIGTTATLNIGGWVDVQKFPNNGVGTGSPYNRVYYSDSLKN